MLMKLNRFLLAIRMTDGSKIIGSSDTTWMILDDTVTISRHFISVNYSRALFHSILRA